jgi:hypothetical protein
MAPKPNPDMDERVSIALDPETALRGLLDVSPDDEVAGAKERKLEALRQATPDELGSARRCPCAATHDGLAPRHGKSMRLRTPTLITRRSSFAS